MHHTACPAARGSTRKTAKQSSKFVRIERRHDFLQGLGRTCFGARDWEGIALLVGSPLTTTSSTNVCERAREKEE